MVLVLLPLWFLRHAYLDPKLRKRLRRVFVLSLFATACAVARGACCVGVGGVWAAILSTIEVRISRPAALLRVTDLCGY